MARTFNGTTDVVSGAGLPGSLSTQPVTMACWFKTSGGAQKNLVGMFKGSGGGNAYALYMYANATNRIVGVRQSNGSFEFHATTPGGTSGAWNHAAVKFTTGNVIRAYLNGSGSQAAQTTTFPAGMTHTVLGADMSTSGVFANRLPGEMAEVGIWNVELTDEDVSILSTYGISPIHVRPESLVLWVPCRGSMNDRLGFSLTDAIPTTDADHPRIYA